MLQHALKRLLILLPAVWLIASVVFLLSKNVPGAAGEAQLEAAAQSANSQAKADAYQRAYRQMLHKTGQDLPLFYFRLGTAAEPDTLYRIFPETHRQALKHFVFTYGNWTRIAAYYKNLQQLTKTAGPGMARETDREVERLLQHPETETTRQVFRRLKTKAKNSENIAFQKAVLTAENSFGKLVTEATPAANFWPKLHWYGFENQYHRWFRNLLHGDLGISARDSRPVSEIVAEAFGVTIWLALAAFVLVGLLAPEIGMLLSRRSARKSRSLVLNFLYALESVPLFIVALVVLAFSSYLGILYDFPEEVSMALVVLCLVLVNLPYLTSQAYTAVQTLLQENFVLTARAKGLPDKMVLRQHVFRNSLLPVITLLSDFFPALLAGTVVLEVIFSVPGMGRLLVSSVLARDYEVITALVLLVGVVKMVSHLLADLLYAFTDPRIRR